MRKNFDSAAVGVAIDPNDTRVRVFVAKVGNHAVGRDRASVRHRRAFASFAATGSENRSGDENRETFKATFQHTESLPEKCDAIVKTLGPIT